MNKQAAPDQRWVCAACGKTTELGGWKYDFRDVACTLKAVLCHADKKDGIWLAVEETQ